MSAPVARRALTLAPEAADEPFGRAAVSSQFESHRLTQTAHPTAAASDGPADDPAQPARLSLLRLSLLALGVGVVTGFGAVAFRDLIGLIHNLAFYGRVSIRYDANVFTGAAAWGPWVILVPVVGGIVVTFLVDNFAPEAKGHGVPEVMDAIYYRGGVIRPVVALVKSLASALAIGTGSSVGREGPIIQIGSALGSIDPWANRPHAGQPAHRARRRRRHARHRRHLQHPDRRGDVRHRADAA